MATLGIRHAVLWVTDPQASAGFYRRALGLEVTSRVGTAVFMASPESNTDHDLGLFVAAGDAAPARHVGLYHLAWEVATLAELAEAKVRLDAMGALVGENNHGTSRSLYCHDPDGIEFELMWEVPPELCDPDAVRNVPLDLDADIARWGADCLSRGARPVTRAAKP
ncbi:VOC family protein [Candidatus Poriferisodalis sp.]|uniref:VOC family protein n=1 Tax=Candidatus Poriferisodalis sp. TaxID=3101277 RepID=UPI003B02728D